MSGKLLAGLSLGVILSFSSVYALAENDAAPVVDASSSYQTEEQAPGTNEAPVSDQSQDDEKQASQNFAGNEVKPENEGVAENESQRVVLPTNLHTLPVGQRVQRLEQQVNNIANMNLPQQITILQQQIAQLRGQLEVQGHDLQLINAQLRSFYKDLDTRINQMNNLNSGGGNSATQAANASNKALSTQTSVELQDANAYQVAFSQLVNHQLDVSKQSFENYLNQYPNGKYVADSHYWLGEIYLSTKDYKNAAAEFETVLSKYPQSSKVSDAKLKIAIIHANTGNVDRAKSELQSIKQSHPDSTAAQLANIRLQQLDDGPDLTGNQQPAKEPSSPK